MLALDGYELQEQVGSGGMGTVWAGIHRDSGVRVAVKVLTAFAARQKRLLSAFRTEIRACAGLHHPSIVRVLDRGDVTAQHEELSGGKLRQGSPYLVMEYVSGGSLVPWCGRLVWSEIRAILLGLLDGLAHAHARGLIHRDIKPANVLLTADRSQVRLTDFGLVHAIARATPGNRDRGLAGTPRYMAPEQVQGLWRDYGPWTDFYALGGLAYALCAGYPPFAQCRTRDELAEAHQRLQHPPLQPRTAVAEGFDEWLDIMLSKAPGDRFQRASEAAMALRSLTDPSDISLLLEDSADETAPDDIATDPAIRAGLPALSLMGETRLSTLQIDEEDWKSSELPAVPDAPTALKPMPPMPTRWGTAEDPTETGLDATSMVGTGLGLYWLRNIPLIGREAERDALWSMLGRVRNSRRAEAVVLHGPSGVGKSRLAEWLSLRAHEIAGADFLKAIHSPNNSPGSGIASMLGRHLRTLGLSAEQVRKRIRALLRTQGVSEADEWLALAELVRPSQDSSPVENTAKVRFGSRWEALRVAQRALERAAADRPVVVWFDDAHWGLDAMLLVQQVLREQDRRASPIFFVLTIQTDELAERALESSLVDDLLSLPGASDIPLGPLQGKQQQRLVRQLLNLDHELADAVEGRTRGNPLFAVQLVGDWVDRKLLEMGAEGYRLKPNQRVRFPRDLAELWASRLETFLSSRSVHDGPALEVAAALGQEITEAGWWSVCEQAGLTPRLDLLDRLLDEGLARSSSAGPSEGWAFAHGLIREALLARAKAAGRLPEHHLACSRHLGFVGGPGCSERIARHLLEADRPLQALGLLAAGTWELLQQEELRRAGALLDDFVGTLDVLGLTEADPRRGQALLLRVHLAARFGDDRSFTELAGEADRQVQANGWSDIGIYVAFEVACQNRRRGRLEAATVSLDLVEAWAESHGDRTLLARSLAEQARLARARVDLTGAEPLHRRSFDLFEQLGDGVEAGRTMIELAEIAARMGDEVRTQACIQGARDFFDRWNSRSGEAECARVRGVAAMLGGDVVAAESSLREAITRFHSLGASGVASAEQALGVLLATSRRFDEAEVLLQSAADRYMSAGDGVAAARSKVAMLPGLANLQAWAVFDECAQEASKLSGDRGFVEQELRDCAELAESLALAADEPARAVLAASLVEDGSAGGSLRGL